MKRILLIGGSGILGSEVLRQLQIENMDFVAPTSSNLDIREKDLIEKLVLDFRPSWIVNCAAWTDVDGAEESFDAALELNERVVRNIAGAAKQISCKIVHISTDYVFNGESSAPHVETAQVNPINKYGESKLRGERALLEVIPKDGYVIRTAWLYGIHGKNFVKTISIKASRNESVRVVDDQVGSPTSARDLAEAIIAIIDKPPAVGIYNFSNSGSCSWFDFARTIYKDIGANPELVEPIQSSSLKFKANRPKYSLLNKEKWESTGLTSIPDWKNSLRTLRPEILKEIRQSEKL